MSEIHERLCRNRPHARHARAVARRRTRFIARSPSRGRLRRFDLLAGRIAADKGDLAHERNRAKVKNARRKRSCLATQRLVVRLGRESSGTYAARPKWRQKRTSRLARMSRQRCRRSAHREAKESLRGHESHRGTRCWRRRGRTVAVARKTPAGTRGKSAVEPSRPP